MKEQIEKLEAQLKELKEVYENEQKTKYESQPHKHFEKGDIVTDGNQIVIVEWTENNACGMPYEKGYMGGSIINGNRGFGSFKRDNFEVVSDAYYKSTQTTMNTEFTEQPFNLETALKHPEWVYFRNGEKPLEWHWFEKINSGWVIYAINQTGGTSLCRKDGTYNATLKIESPYDLILRVPYREVWVNIYPNGNCVWYDTKEEANEYKSNSTTIVACVPVKIPAI